MSTANIAYCDGTAIAASSDTNVVRRAIPAFGPVLYNTAGDARLCSNVEVTTEAAIPIPAEALAVGALIRVAMVSGGAYFTTGMDGDESGFTAGEGLYVAEGAALPLEIGKTPAGVQHTHIIAIAAA